MQRWFIYILKNQKGGLYTGITTNVARRLHEHKTSSLKKAKFFRISSPDRIIYVEIVESRKRASRRELQIKSMTRLQKLELLNLKQNIIDKYF